MSKFDSKITAATAVSAELDELLAALVGAARPAPDRSDAMAQFLSGQEGWRDAREALRGAFAKASPRGTGLMQNKDR